jgi:hypothetical protein
MPRLLNRDFVSVSIPQQPVKKPHSPAPRLSGLSLLWSGSVHFILDVNGYFE